MLSEIQAAGTLEPLLRVASLSSSDDGHDDLDDLLGDSDEGSDLEGLLRFLATKRPEESIEIDGRSVVTHEVLATLNAAISAAAEEEASEANRDQSAAEEPLKKLELALSNLVKARMALPRARALQEWDEEGFDQRVTEVETELAQLRANS